VRVRVRVVLRVRVRVRVRGRVGVRARIRVRVRRRVRVVLRVRVSMRVRVRVQARIRVRVRGRETDLSLGGGHMQRRALVVVARVDMKLHRLGVREQRTHSLNLAVRLRERERAGTTSEGNAQHQPRGMSTQQSALSPSAISRVQSPARARRR
jgi:hypothetical protein